MEEVLFKSEEKLSRTEISERLQRIAEKIADGELNLQSGSDSITISPAQNSEFETKVEKEGDKVSLELEIEWNENSKESSGLQID